MGPGRRAAAASRRPTDETNLTLRSDGRQVRHGRAVGLLPGLHTLHEQVHDHPDLADEGRDDQERLDLQLEVGNQERRSESAKYEMVARTSTTPRALGNSPER